MIICWPGSLILLWWYDYNKPRPKEVTNDNKRLREVMADLEKDNHTMHEEGERLREENAALQERLENKNCSQCGSKLDIYGVCLSADAHGNCTKHREAVDWVNTPHQCSPGTCGHQPATLHIDCVDPWHRLPSQEISFSCPTCRAA